MRVLVLGHKGMLGHMVAEYLRYKDIKVETTDLRWPSEDFKHKLMSFTGCCIVNCIGAIPQKTDSFDINYELPVWLDQNSRSRIVHPGSDCEENTNEYAESKLKATEWLKKHAKKTKILKSSIIGPELTGKKSLFEWFLGQNGKIDGYTQYYWNGNTTLTWARHCYRLFNYWDEYEKESILEGECISKYDLLICINEVFEAGKQITPYLADVSNRCLTGNIKTDPIKDQLLTLKSWVHKNKFLYL